MNKYWFRKRRGIISKDLGWGWVPISWEGWCLVVAFILLIGISGNALGIYSDNVAFMIRLQFLGLSMVLLFIAAWLSKKKTRPE